MNDWRINFGRNLYHLRQTHGLTQVEMAKIVGVSVHTYRKMEKACPNVRIHAGRIHRICDRFQVTSDAILYQNREDK